MKVSLIIINYNTYSLTTQCICSVLNKTNGIDFEIILVDNASTECDPHLFKQTFPQIKLICSEKNLGFSGGNNLGIEQAKGEYILLLNSDTELINDAISEAYQLISYDNSIGVITGQLQYANGEIQAQAGRFPSLRCEYRELVRINKFLPSSKRPSYYLGTQWNYEIPVEADWVWGAFFMFKKSDLDFFPNKKLHDTFFMYGEDVQWCYHFKHVVGKKIMYHPAPKVIHYIGGSDTNNHTTEEKFLKKMLPNEHRWLKMVKGNVYAALYYFIKSLHYFSLRNSESRKKGAIFLKLAITGKL
jgi:GT2 family glycosyltransferase